MRSVRWVTEGGEGGDAYGFGTHAREQRAALERRGWSTDDSAEIAVHVVTPMMFKPLPGKINVLNTHWELPDLAPVQVEKIRAANLVVVASQWVADVFESHGLRRPEVVPLGVDRRFRPRRRTTPGRGHPFRWLWVGAPNLRKGYDLLVTDPSHAWQHFADKPGIELYLKTSTQGGEGKVVRHGNITFNSLKFGRK